ncbi:MAG: hypothetical protein QNJ45_12225 [Ardenticatenaceae bacterium]|nr:hypothetical protein [Ardenticatenaceae bacterium]
MTPSILFQIDPNAFLDFLLLAYGVMWLIAFGYVLSLVFQQHNLRRDINLLKQLIEEENNENA